MIDEHDDGGAPTEIARTFARCFSTPDGVKVLAHLRSQVNGYISPDNPEAVLRDMEGRRGLFMLICLLIDRGSK